jgi:hypothetical protein
MDVSNLENKTANDDNGKNHNHGISRGTKFVTGVTTSKDSDGKVTEVTTTTIGWTPSGAHTHGSHSHKVNIGTHSHTVSIGTHEHTTTIPSHTHSTTIPSHTHTTTIPSHTHGTTLPNHTHDIQYGIYKGFSASGMTVQIDGVTVGSFGYGVDNVNLIAYMSKNSNGEVLRGRHTIRITPNALTRVECAVQIRLFTNSHGAGQY